MDSFGQAGKDARVWKSSDGKHSITAAIVELESNATDPEMDEPDSK